MIVRTTLPGRLLVGVIGLTLGGGIGAALASGDGTQPMDPPAMSDPAVESEPLDMGAGERILLVVGGGFPSREAAEAANQGFGFGDLQGFYVVRTDQFDGLRDGLGAVGDNDYVLASAFRTEAGAREFLDLATAAGASAFVSERVVNRAWEYAGLGQEAAPDGSGPLRGALPGVTTP